MIVSHVAVRRWRKRLHNGSGVFSISELGFNDFFGLFYENGNEIDVYAMACFCALGYLDMRKSVWHWVIGEIYVTDKGLRAIRCSKDSER